MSVSDKCNLATRVTYSSSTQLFPRLKQQSKELMARNCWSKQSVWTLLSCDHRLLKVRQEAKVEGKAADSAAEALAHGEAVKMKTRVIDHMQ